MCAAPGSSKRPPASPPRWTTGTRTAYDALAFTHLKEVAPEENDNGRVTVLVSHRFSTVRMADLIVVLDGARVTEVGSHAELVARGGTYAELYALQARSYA